MTFAIITHVPHGKEASHYAYGPYVREMDIWMKFVGRVIVAAPLQLHHRSELHDSYSREVSFVEIPAFDLLSLKSAMRALLVIPRILLRLYRVMDRADHIHLRCPGNIGLLGCMVQLFFPSKPKTAKYAGNWDPKAPQPISYRVQKWILSNTLLTRNMTVLVYGDWPGASANIKTFFTASYSDAQREIVAPRTLNGRIYFVFAGSLVHGKRPKYAIELIEGLARKGINVHLTIFGSGRESGMLQQYVKDQMIDHLVTFEGAKSKDTVREAYMRSHFLLLPSMSEGWPKVVAEAMFWGCVPLATEVSCVPAMLGHGDRGIVLSIEPTADIAAIESLIGDHGHYERMSVAAAEWSQQFTTDRFESEIRTLLQ